MEKGMGGGGMSGLRWTCEGLLNQYRILNNRGCEWYLMLRRAPPATEHGWSGLGTCCLEQVGCCRRMRLNVVDKLAGKKMNKIE